MLVDIFLLEMMISCARCQNSVIFHYTHDHQTISYPYIFYFLICLSFAAWLAFHLCQNWILATLKLSFLFPYLLICHSPKSFRLNFWILPCPFSYFAPIFISILSLQYLLFNLFHFILITTIMFYVLNSVLLGSDPFILKLLRTSKSFFIWIASIHI